VHPIPLGTHRFAFFTATTADHVWEFLTCAGETPKYFHGLAVSSSWRVGDPVQICRPRSGPECGDVLTGRVICVRPRSRLSFYFHSGTNDPPTYLTWEMRSSTGGTVVQLQVDHVEHVEELADAEDTWLPVLAALQALLPLEGPARPSGR